MRRAVLGCCAVAARAQLPAVISEAAPHVHPRALAELETLFAPGGPHESFAVRIEEGCVGGAFPTYDWRRPQRRDALDAKWGLESLLAARLARSRWFTTNDAAPVSLVAFRPRTSDRAALTRCRAHLEATSPGKRFWFAASTDRGRCCDGGQLRDPGLLNHHFLVMSGERRRGAWLFREHNTKHAWRAPPSRNSAPRLRCFDQSNDVALPPPAFLRGLHVKRDERRDARARNATRPFLAVHAEGGVAPPEYDLRRLLTARWAPDWWANARNASWAGHPALLIRKAMARTAHDDALFASKYCLVVEGFAPWTPRLSEAIGAGCVPAILSPALLLPFAGVLRWRDFAVILKRADVANLPAVLEKYDHAALHANLLRVRRLLSFVAAGRDTEDDALPLVVFEMWRRTKRRGAPYAAGTATALAAVEATGVSSDVEPAAVPFACAADGASCVYAVRGTAWNCSRRTKMACGCAPAPAGPRRPRGGP